MGFPPMLNGKNKKLSSTSTFTCPECGNEFNSFDVVNKNSSQSMGLY
jgi:transcription elongation factor Elf1